MGSVCPLFNIACQRMPPAKDKLGDMFDNNEVVKYVAVQSSAVVIKITEPATSAWFGNLVGMEIIATHLRPKESEILGVGPSNMYFNKPSMCF